MAEAKENAFFKMNKNNHNEPLVLVTQLPDTYYSNDAEAFFEWMKKIESIQRFGSIGKSFCIDINREKLGSDDLLNLLGLFQRYNLPGMEQFQQFLNDENRIWFRKKKKDSFWYDSVWGACFKKPSKKSHKAINLLCELPTFHHQHDEEAFYDWLHKARCIDQITKKDSHLVLEIPKPSLVYDEDLGSLIALFDRYSIPSMEQFQQFASEDRAWIANKKSYWYKKVWPKNRP